MSTMPTRAYLVCATPRSGSTLLCQLLGETGVAGRPEEFFESLEATGAPRHGRAWFDGADVPVDDLVPAGAGPDGPAYSTLRDVGDYREHLARTLATGTTPNGVFGAKVMWGHLDEAAALAGEADAEAFVRRLLGDVEPRFVWVRRYDTARQAVSLWRAIQTGSWRKDEAGSAERRPCFDFAAIDHLVGLLRAHDAAWERWFAERSIEPLTFRYRQIAADAPSAAQAVIEHVGIADPPAPANPRLERQADELNEAWVERYNAEAGQEAVDP